MATVEIEQAGGTWVVRAGGAVLGETQDALVVVEDGHDDVIYFPREDIAMEFLDESDHRATCPRKGEARYFDIVTKSTTLRNAVWSYESPNAVAERIAGYLAFAEGEKVAVEKI